MLFDVIAFLVAVLAVALVHKLIMDRATVSPGETVEAPLALGARADEGPARGRRAALKAARGEKAARVPAIDPMPRRALLRGGLLTGVAVLADQLTPGEGSAQAPQAPQGAQPATSLAQAVRAAEQQTGGRARKAEMERERGAQVYEIKTVSKDGWAKVLIDPASGNVLRVQTPGFIAGVASVFDRDDQRKGEAAFTFLAASSVTLEGAIDLAEKAIGGRAVKAALKSRHGSMVFETSVIKDWTKHRVLVDPATGKVVTSPARDDD
jgi:uncharacterized membrane protein YkoI